MSLSTSSTVLLMIIYSRIITADKYVKMYNLVCEPSPKWAANATCALKVIGRNVVIANLEMDARRTFKNITIHAKLFKFYNQFRPFFVDIKFNLCDILNKKSASNFYISQALRVISKYSNAVRCPLEVRNLKETSNFT